MRIDSVEIGPDFPCRVVAEISSNHMGDLGRALRLIKAAKDAGADFLKTQCYSLPEILDLRGDGQAPAPWDAYTKRMLYTIGQTPYDWFPILFASARHQGIVPFSTVLGRESLVILQREDCPAFKLPSYEAGADWLREVVLEAGKPVVVSSGALKPPEADPQVLTLYCPPGYPVMPGDVVFVPGYDGASLHTTNVETVLEVARAGAHMIEVHLMLDADEYEAPPLDAAFSYTPGQLATLVERIHAVG